MTETTTYDNLRFSISRIMLDDVPNVTRAIDRSSHETGVAAKLYIGEDSGWHVVRGLAYTQLGRFTSRTVVEEHRQRPTLADPTPETHSCTGIGCYCFTITEDNIYYGWGRSKTQAANVGAVTHVLENVVMRMCGKAGFDIFAVRAPEEQLMEVDFLRGLRGPEDQSQRLFMNDSLARMLDIRLGIIPQ